MSVSVDPGKCPQNHRCPLIDACPAGAISQEGNGLPFVDAGLCIGCGLCVESCPKGAMRGDE
ncbi:4Fe-4S binding protein [Gallalistipes aquisgranensis]|uniref:4Fe-4S binding protein n=1 Tax=Gallalistipes aquisgranensis TaxID=2779358 RepID=UPI001CF929C1|nr:4Fe-4S binding protein [Gallalistipes aquisgranensis]MBE5032857.1 4Fe-4S binding protein [Gallalistipes aquisgranensis]